MCIVTILFTILQIIPSPAREPAGPSARAGGPASLRTGESGAPAHLRIGGSVIAHTGGHCPPRAPADPPPPVHRRTRFLARRRTPPPPCRRGGVPARTDGPAPPRPCGPEQSISSMAVPTVDHDWAASSMSSTCLLGNLDVQTAIWSPNLEEMAFLYCFRKNLIFIV